MKRLGVVVSLILLSVSLFGDFSHPKEALAQTQAIEQSATYDYFQNEVNTLFKNSLDALSGIRAARAKITPPPTKTLANIDAYVELVKSAESVYTTNFNQGKSQGVPPAKNQASALRASYDTYNNSYSKIDAEVFSDPDVNSIRTLLEVSGFKNLIAQADQINAGLISPGDDKANALANASNAIKNVGSTRAAEIQDKCSFPVNFSLIACINEGVTWIIKNTFLEFAGFLLWASANIFNTSIQMGVLHFSDWAPDTLYPIWMIIRQIISLAIVFIGLYLGFMYILGKEETFERYIPWVVMFGLFVNFSYPLIRTAIDISNIVSLNIYASAVGSSALSGGSSHTAGALIVSALGLNGLMASVTSGSTEGMVGSISSVPAALAAVAFVAYAAFIFIRVTMIMIGRTVALVFLTIASPLLLVDAVIPVLGERAKFLRKILFEQLAVGPVFMIMLALTLKFLEVFTKIGGGVTSSGLGTTSDATVSVFFNIIMMLIMLHIMIKVTVSVSGTVGTWATETIGKVGGFGLGVATGGAGLLARKGLGSLALKARDSGWVQKNQDSFLGRRAYDLSNSVANSSFDLRNNKYVANTANKLGMSTGMFGMGMGSGTKIGHEEESEKKTKAITARGARIKTRYERDEYKKDALGRVMTDEKGQAIILHKKGEINQEADEAKQRYLDNNGGAASVFLTGKEKDRLKDVKDADVEVRKKEKIEEYNKEKTKEAKDAFVANLNKELGDLKKTDPAGLGVKSMVIAKTLEDIDKKKAEEKEAGDKRVADIAKIYERKKGAEAEKYLSDQDAAIQDAVKAHIEAQKNPQTSSNSSAVSNTKASTPSATTRIEDTNWDAYDTPAASRKTSLPSTPSVSSTSSAPPASDVNVSAPLEDVQTVSVQQRYAAKRAAAQQQIQKNLDAGGTGITQKEEAKPGFLMSAEEKIRTKESSRPTPAPVISSSPSIIGKPVDSTNPKEGESTAVASV